MTVWNSRKREKRREEKRLDVDDDDDDDGRGDGGETYCRTVRIWGGSGGRLLGVGRILTSFLATAKCYPF